LQKSVFGGANFLTHTVVKIMTELTESLYFKN